MQQRPPRLRGKLIAKPAVRDFRLVVYVGGKERVVVAGEQIYQPGDEFGVDGAIRRETGGAGAELADRPHWDGLRRQFL